jgi:epsilon-lactone hydrolase
MPRIVFSGPRRYILRSLASLLKISTSAFVRRLVGRAIASDWPLDFEIGNLFWREQFRQAMSMTNMAEARVYFDSLQTYTDETFNVKRRVTESGKPKGSWITPDIIKTDAVILYFHGGGYAFFGQISHRYGDMLADQLGARLFELDYRLTPEHPHPAQQDDAIAAYRHLLDEGIDPTRIVIIGDSAGGHLTLMTLIELQKRNLPQPGLAIGLCPWTDIGDRGVSLFDKDKFDLVQGYMALQFGTWLKRGTNVTRKELSPINQNFKDLAPIYLQAGGREILIDMIREFTDVLEKQNVDIRLDIWPYMTHNFHAHGQTRPESSEALACIEQAIAHYITAGKTGPF